MQLSQRPAWLEQAVGNKIPQIVVCQRQVVQASLVVRLQRQFYLQTTPQLILAGHNQHRVTVIVYERQHRQEHRRGRSRGRVELS